MSKHTPGPWFVADWTCFDGDNLLTVEAREPEITEAGQSGIWPDGIRKMKVASTDDGSFDRSTNLANAQLIAAAPEMLKLIQALSTATESGFGSEVSMKTLYGRLVCLRNEALRLLARIEGGEE